MKTSKRGLDLIKKYEGFESKPYLCPAQKPTIGYGATHYGNGVKVTMSDKPIDEEHASCLLINMITEYENSVKMLVQKPINQNQFDALVSFTYNLGAANLSKSTLLKKINANPKDKTIKDEFLKWNKAKGKELTGLTRRRNEEAILYFSQYTDGGDINVVTIL